ncbi:MAG: hypothetical protein H7335_04495 [Massilia sp.]|nr:hypothetical protein [Massilia sp.]
MNNGQGRVAVQPQWRWCLLGLCGSSLLACGGGGTDPGPPKAPLVAALMGTGETALAGTAPGGGADLSAADAACGRNTTYSIIQLGSGQLTELPVINASNQVVFSVSGGTGSRAAFFNGKTVIELGTLGGAEAYAPALNDAGQVAGYSSNPGGNYRAFRWSQGAGMVDLGTLYGAGASKGLGINAQGQVAGYSEPALAPVQAFVWSEAAGMLDLGRLGTGMGSAWAQAINDRGMATGSSDALDGNAHAFAWTRAGGMVDLGTVGGIDSYATHINNAGQIAGYSAVNNAAGFNYHGFAWSRATGIIDIGTLSGLGSAALAMNASGQVAGVSDTTDLYQHAIAWTRKGGLVDLGTLGGTMSRALGINRSGVVVGWSNTRAGQFDYRAFLWTREQGMVDLNRHLAHAPAGLVVSEAVAISDSGAIVANSNAGLVLLQPGATGTDAPVIGPVKPFGAGVGAVAAGTRMTFSAEFTDQNTADTHSATWSWGERCARNAATATATVTATVTVTESAGAGTARGQHAFCTAGVHPVTLTVTDSSGRSATVARDVVVYDPSTAAMTGTGWFLSPQGAYKKERIHAGRASFSVVAARAGGSVLKFNVANLNFQSGAFDAQSVAKGRAQYGGSGTLNGRGNYQFALSAQEGGDAGAATQGRLRMKIWHRDARAGAEIVDYDNQIAARAHPLTARMVAETGAGSGASEGSAIGGGSIVLHR